MTGVRFLGMLVSGKFCTVDNTHSPVPTLTTGFVPKVVGSNVGERVEGPSYTGPWISLTRIHPHVSLPGYWGPNTFLLSFTRFRSPYHRPLASGPQAHVPPQ